MIVCAAAKLKTLWEKVIQVCETAPRISPALITPGHNTHENQETLMDLHHLLWSRKLPTATTGWYQVHALTQPILPGLYLQLKQDGFFVAAEFSEDNLKTIK